MANRGTASWGTSASTFNQGGCHCEMWSIITNTDRSSESMHLFRHVVQYSVLIRALNNYLWPCYQCVTTETGTVVVQSCAVEVFRCVFDFVYFWQQLSPAESSDAVYRPSWVQGSTSCSFWDALVTIFILYLWPVILIQSCLLYQSSLSFRPQHCC